MLLPSSFSTASFSLLPFTQIMEVGRDLDFIAAMFVCLHSCLPHGASYTLSVVNSSDGSTPHSQGLAFFARTVALGNVSLHNKVR